MDLARLKELLRVLLLSDNDNKRMEVALQVDQLTAGWFQAQWDAKSMCRSQDGPNVPSSIRASMTGFAGPSGVMRFGRCRCTQVSSRWPPD